MVINHAKREESGKLRLLAAVCNNCLLTNRLNAGTVCADWFYKE